MDILDEMTKSEIIEWLRSTAAYIFRPPKKSALLFIRWQRKSKLLAEKDLVNIVELEKADSSKRDEYAKRFNASSDTNEKLSLLKKMKPYKELVTRNIKASQKIRKEYKALDKLYVSIEIERQKEERKKE
jgi:hypothetical protein